MHGHDHHHEDTHTHDHDHHGPVHGHTHGPVDPTILTSRRGIWATKWSLAGLAVTALLQLLVVYFSGSVALLADTIHNFGDAATAIPLWVAFTLVQRRPSRRFTYGYGRVEDLAGVAVVLTILVSAVVAGYESVQRLLHPQTVQYLWAVILASMAGFLGNEAVALFRIRVGKEIGSAALVADGYHARADGLASLAVLGGAGGVWMGYPVADPLIGLIITLLILRIVWQSGRVVLTRLIDGVDPDVVDQIEQTVRQTAGVRDVGEVRVRWLGHRLHADVNLAVDPGLSVAEGHTVATEARHQLLHSLGYLSNATIHVDPTSTSGEEHHRIENHVHSGLGPHSH